MITPIAVVGPTASGKTALSLDLAEGDLPANRAEDGRWRVPKRDLAGAINTALQDRRLHIAARPPVNARDLALDGAAVMRILGVFHPSGDPASRAYQSRWSVPTPWWWLMVPPAARIR